MDVNDHDLCCMCINHDFMHKSEVNPTRDSANMEHFCQQIWS